VWADPRSAGAATFVEDLGGKAIDALIRPRISRDEAERRFRALLNEAFDGPYIGRFVLGPYWRAATPEQQKDYMELFEKLIVQIYAGRFTEYAG
jgi:phospholipid transport system substrate-binding protein